MPILIDGQRRLPSRSVESPPPWAPIDSPSETLAFRERRIARLTAEDGWLTLVGRYPLDPGDNALPIGTVTLDERGVVKLSVSPGLTVTCDGQAIRERVLRPTATPARRTASSTAA